jgi:F-type H+-transporting ATPase subunit b
MRQYIYFLVLLISTTSLYANKAAEAGHHGIDWNLLGGSIFNFFLLLGLLIFFTKKPIKQALKKRKEEMEAEINKYKIEKENAVAKLNEYEAKLSQLDLDVAEIKMNYEKASRAKEEALIKRNKEDLKKLNASYEKELETRIQSLHNELKSELMDNAINLSKELIESKFVEDSKLEVEFIKKFKMS